MDAPIPAQKSPYGVTVEAGKRYFWCACGRSQGQPFCDGSHKGTSITPLMYTPEKSGQGDRQAADVRRNAQQTLALDPGFALCAKRPADTPALVHRRRGVFGAGCRQPCRV
jgi:CDGSH-type Zn-finger protein